jgi:hypothetical protein
MLRDVGVPFVQPRCLPLLIGVLQFQTFRGRLPDIMDQAQHFTGKASAATSGGDDVTAEFRAGLEASERECMSYLSLCRYISSFTYPV